MNFRMNERGSSLVFACALLFFITASITSYMMWYERLFWQYDALQKAYEQQAKMEFIKIKQNL